MPEEKSCPLVTIKDIEDGKDTVFRKKHLYIFVASGLLLVIQGFIYGLCSKSSLRKRILWRWVLYKLLLISLKKSKYY